MSTYNVPLSIKKENHKYNNVCSYGIFFPWTLERVRNNRGKRDIGVRAIEVLLYLEFN